MTTRATLGLIVNPIAGMGGRVGLKGTDGPGTAARARALGATPLSPARAQAALAVVAERLLGQIEVVTAPGTMGEDLVRAAGFAPRIVGRTGPDETTAGDTEAAAAAMADFGVDLLLFAGGDGTARNVCAAIGTRVPALGIPTGVKMHSAVYATHPRTAGELAARHLGGPPRPCREAEVMDIDEEAFRAGRVSARLYGTLLVPQERRLVQGLKSGSGGGDASDLGGIAAEIAGRMGDGALWIVGPGTTTRAIAERLGAPKTLLGVDLFSRGELVAADVTETQILAHLDHLDHLDGAPARIVVTPIGGQGYLFGRGNQQLSAEVIRRVGKANVVVVATTAKLAALRGEPFLVDTGEAEVDEGFAGYVRVVTGYGVETVYRVG
jgi:predicted polyphosphate/ATP-dependent NAD kinase